MAMPPKLETLHLHASLGKHLKVRSLVNGGVDPNGKNSSGQTALMLAAGAARGTVVEVLINSGADLDCCDDIGRTVLHYASHKGSVEIVKCLVKRGVALNVKKRRGLTPLMVATVMLHREVAEVLINSGADLNCCDDNGWTPLHFAIGTNGMEIANYLLKAGADSNLEDFIGESPFSLLIRKKKHIETIKLCIEMGAYVKSYDYYGLLSDPLLTKVILQDVKLCSQAVINKFNNRDLHLLYNGCASAQKLPRIDKMKIGNKSGMALGVEQAVSHEIQVKGFCNLLKIVPLVLGMLCVKTSIEK